MSQRYLHVNMGPFLSEYDDVAFSVACVWCALDLRVEQNLVRKCWCITTLMSLPVCLMSTLLVWLCHSVLKNVSTFFHSVACELCVD